MVRVGLPPPPAVLKKPETKETRALSTLFQPHWYKGWHKVAILFMARSVRQPASGIIHFRKAIPERLRKRAGMTAFKRSLSTRDAKAARKWYAERAVYRGTLIMEENVTGGPSDRLADKTADKSAVQDLVRQANRALKQVPIWAGVLSALASALATGIVGYYVTPSQERVRTVESLRKEMLSNYFLPTESQRPQITAFKWFGKRFDVLLFADDEVAQLLAERGQIGCNRLNNFSEECRDQIVPLLNAFRKELGLSQLSPAVVKDALSFPDTMADIYGPTRSAATAEPPPPPSIPSLPSFMLFFDHDQSHLSPQAINTVKQAADAFKTHPGLVLVSGNTDTSEATELSLRRANEVKDVLVANGVPPTAIAVIARGATFLLVPTANHIREPQNRRVLITLRPDK